MALEQIFCTEDGVARRAGDSLELLTGPETTLVELVRTGRLGELRGAASQRRVPLDGARLRPVCAPTTVALVGFNYASHAQETGYPIPAQLLFGATQQIRVDAPGTDLRLPDGASAMVDYEAEVGVVIGAAISGTVDVDTAAAAVAGVCAVNDLTARDRQLEAGRKSPPDMEGVVAAKAYPGFKPAGPGLIVAPPEAWLALDLELEARVNGERRQFARTAEMVFSIPQVVQAVAASTPLAPGDLICTGTPAGVGLVRQVFLQPGDIVEVRLSPLPPLNTVIQSQEA